MNPRPRILIAREPNTRPRRPRTGLRLQSNALGAQRIHSESSTLQPQTANAAQLVRALQSAATRQDAIAEINKRLKGNKANRYFFWLVYGWQINDEDIASEAYKNLRELGIRYLNRTHRPLIKVRPRKGDRPVPVWDDVIHQTLVGNVTVKGEVEKSLRLTCEELWKTRFGTGTATF